MIDELDHLRATLGEMRLKLVELWHERQKPWSYERDRLLAQALDMWPPPDDSYIKSTVHKAAVAVAEALTAHTKAYERYRTMQLDFKTTAEVLDQGYATIIEAKAIQDAALATYREQRDAG